MFHGKPGFSLVWNVNLTIVICKLESIEETLLIVVLKQWLRIVRESWFRLLSVVFSPTHPPCLLLYNLL